MLLLLLFGLFHLHGINIRVVEQPVHGTLGIVVLKSVKYKSVHEWGTYSVLQAQQRLSTSEAEL